MDEKIMEILCTICGVDPEEMEPDLDLFAEGLLDSFGVINLFVELESAFSIKIEPTEIERSEINTPEKLIACIRRKLA